MTQRYSIHETHQGSVGGVPTQLLGGQVVTDDEWSIPDLLAAGFVLVPQVEASGDASLVLSPLGYVPAGGGGVPLARTITTTAPVRIDGAASADLSADRTLSLLYDASLVLGAGMLSRAALTGDVTAAAGGNATTIAANAVTNAKAADMPASTLKGNNTGGVADPADLTVAQVKALLAYAAGDISGLAAIASSGSAADLVAGILPAARFPALTGDVTTVAGALATTLRAGAATSVIGRSANSIGNVADIAAVADGDVLRRAAGVLGFGAIPVASVTGAALAARNINTTAPIGGGGDLTADRTITLTIDGTLAVAAGALGRAALAAGEVTAPAGSNVLTVVQAELAGLKALATTGLVERTGAGAYGTRTIGVGGGTEVPDRAAADTRYAQISLITPAIMRPMWASFTNITSNVSIGSTTCPAWYFGRTKKALTTVDVRTKIVTVMTGTTWCELAIATGPAPIPATGATLTVVGYYSTGVSGAPFNSTNPSTVTIPVSGGLSINAGDHLWLVFAKLSTGSPSFRAGGAADELSTGQYVDGGNVRPSVIQGTPTAFAIGATTTNLMTFFVYI